MTQNHETTTVIRWLTRERRAMRRLALAEARRGTLRLLVEENLDGENIPCPDRLRPAFLKGVDYLAVYLAVHADHASHREN